MKAAATREPLCKDDAVMAVSAHSAATAGWPFFLIGMTSAPARRKAGCQLLQPLTAPWVSPETTALRKISTKTAIGTMETIDAANKLP